MRVYGWELLAVHHHLDTFGDHKHCGSGDGMLLISHVTSQNHVIERSCISMSGGSSFYVTTLPSLLAIGVVVVEI